MSRADQQLLDVAGFQISDAAEALSKSRQAVSRGIKQRADYFQLQDILLIIRSMSKKYPSRKEELEEFVSLHYSKWADFIIAAAHTFDFGDSVAEAKHAVVFVDNYEHFSGELRKHSRLLDLLLQAVGRVEFITTTEESARTIRSACQRVNAEDRVSISISEITRLLPVVVLLDPHASARGFVADYKGFSPLTKYQTLRLARTLVDESVAPRLKQHDKNHDPDV